MNPVLRLAIERFLVKRKFVETARDVWQKGVHTVNLSGELRIYRERPSKFPPGARLDSLQEKVFLKWLMKRKKKSKKK